MDIFEEEHIYEELTKYSDRQIIIEVLELLTDKQLRNLIKNLKENF